MSAINETNFKPLRALILVRRDDPETEAGGIIIPDNVKTYGWRATVLRVGPDADGYEVGDAILFQKEFTVLPCRDRTLALTDAKHVLAKLSVVDKIERIKPQNKFVLVFPCQVESSANGIFFPDKSKPPPDTGDVVEASGCCHEVVAGMKVWFEHGVGVNCVENGEGYKLIDESNILAMQNGGE